MNTRNSLLGVLILGLTLTTPALAEEAFGQSGTVADETTARPDGGPILNRDQLLGVGAWLVDSPFGSIVTGSVLQKATEKYILVSPEDLRRSSWGNARTIVQGAREAWEQKSDAEKADFLAGLEPHRRIIFRTNMMHWRAVLAEPTFGAPEPAAD